MKWLFIPRFDTAVTSANASTALMILRLIVGTAFIFHGYSKILSPFDWMGPESPFPGFLLAMAALAEFGGGICILLGFLTPLVSLALIANMSVAILAVHLPNGDPFLGGFELPLVFWGLFILLFNIGPGRYSLDHRLFRSYSENRKSHSVSQRSATSLA